MSASQDEPQDRMPLIADLEDALFRRPRIDQL